MRTVTHLLLSLSLVGISGLPLILVWGHAADQPESNERYYPLPSSPAVGGVARRTTRSAAWEEWIPNSSPG